MIADTSIEVFKSIHNDGVAQTQYQRILNFFKSHENVTRREVSVALGIEPGAVAGRVNTLIAVGKLVEAPRRRCTITGRSAHTLNMR